MQTYTERCDKRKMQNRREEECAAIRLVHVWQCGAKMCVCVCVRFGSSPFVCHYNRKIANHKKPFAQKYWPLAKTIIFFRWSQFCKSNPYQELLMNASFCWLSFVVYLVCHCSERLGILQIFSANEGAKARKNNQRESGRENRCLELSLNN